MVKVTTSTPSNKTNAIIKKKGGKTKQQLLLKGPKTASHPIASTEASKTLKELFRRLIQDVDGNEITGVEPRSHHHHHSSHDASRDEVRRVDNDKRKKGNGLKSEQLQSQFGKQGKTHGDSHVITQDKEEKKEQPQEETRQRNEVFKKLRDKNNSESQARIHLLKKHLIFGVNEVMKSVSRRKSSGVILSHPLETHLQSSIHDLCRENNVPCLSVPDFVDAISSVSSIGIAFKSLPVSGSKDEATANFVSSPLSCSLTPTLVLHDCFREFISACQEKDCNESLTPASHSLDPQSSSCPASHVTLDPLETKTTVINCTPETNKTTTSKGGASSSSHILHFLTPSDEQLYETEKLSLESDKVVASGMKKIEDEMQEEGEEEESGVILFDKKEERHFFPQRLFFTDSLTSHFRVVVNSNDPKVSVGTKSSCKKNKICQTPMKTSAAASSGSGIGFQTPLDSNNSDKSIVKFRESESVSLTPTGKRAHKKQQKKLLSKIEKNESSVELQDPETTTVIKKTKKSK
jgi:ribosomal protein L7Ae-like RNA K-turn-binding protein